MKKHGIAIYDYLLGIYRPELTDILHTAPVTIELGLDQRTVKSLALGGRRFGNRNYSGIRKGKGFALLKNKQCSYHLFKKSPPSK